MRQSCVDPDDDHHLDGNTSSINDSDPDLTENESPQQQQQEQKEQQHEQQKQQQQQKQQTKYGAWGHDITTIYNEDDCFVFQEINGLTSFTGTHE
jgi:hypothetical protein